MEASELSLADARATSRPAPSGWIRSPAFDLTFFVLSPLVALPVLIASPQGPSFIALFAGTMLGVPHYLSTFAFFFWDETRDYHRAKWPLFFGGPALIVALLCVMVFFRVPVIVQMVVYIWNTIHVARQSCGILSIYRHRAGVRAPEHKSIANNAIMAVAFMLVFWNTPGYPTLDRALTFVSPALPQAIWLIAATATVVFVGRLAISLLQRFRSEARPHVPELVFLATSLLLFHPYIWIEDGNRATLGMLLGHFVQYLGIVWFVHRRKFDRLREARPNAWLVKLSTNLPLLVLACTGAGGLFLAFYYVTEHFSVPAIYESLYLSLALVHFYLDGLFWAFRRPEVRQSLGPHLMAPPSARTAAQPTMAAKRA